MKYKIIYSFLICFLILSTTISIVPTVQAVQTDLDQNQFQAILNPMEDGTEYDVDDPEMIPTGYDNWLNDLGDQIPEGIYLGSALQPSILDTGYEQTYQNTYLEVQENIEFTSTEIINGCSEFWIRYPIVWNPDYYDSNRDWVIVINDDWIECSNVFQKGSSVYAKINAIIVPDITYRIKLMIPMIFWEIPEVALNGFYRGITGNIEITGENIANSSGTGCYSLLTSEYLGDPRTSSFTTRSNRSLPDGITFGISFIFTKGIGNGGLFGRSYTVMSNADVRPITFGNKYTLLVIETILPYETGYGAGYISIMIPFSSLSPITLLWASVDISGDHFTGYPSDFGYYEINEDYEGFFIFTMPNSGSFVSGNDINLEITLSVRNSIDQVGSISLLHNSGSVQIGRNKYAYDGEIFLTGYDLKTDIENVELSSFYEYDAVAYSSLTSGTWAYATPTETNNVFQYTKVFRTKIYVPITIYEIIKENKDGSTTTIYSGYNKTDYEKGLVEYGVVGFDKPSDPFKSLGSQFINAVKSIWDGVKVMYGFILDGLQIVYDSMLKLGEITVNSFLKLEQILKSITAFIQDNIINILELIWIMIAPLTTLFLIVYVFKPLKNMIYQGVEQ